MFTANVEQWTGQSIQQVKFGTTTRVQRERETHTTCIWLRSSNYAMHIPHRSICVLFLCPIFHFRRWKCVAWRKASSVSYSSGIKIHLFNHKKQSKCLFLPFSCSHSLTSISQLASFVFILIMHVALWRAATARFLCLSEDRILARFFFMNRFSHFSNLDRNLNSARNSPEETWWHWSSSKTNDFHFMKSKLTHLPNRNAASILMAIQFMTFFYFFPCLHFIRAKRRTNDVPVCCVFRHAATRR